MDLYVRVLHITVTLCFFCFFPFYIQVDFFFCFLSFRGSSCFSDNDGVIEF